MADYRAPLEDIHFVMNNVFDLPSLWASLPGLEEADADTARAILDEAAKMCEQELAPLNREADEQGCQWNEGQVTSPDGFKQAYQTFCEGGWGALSGNPEYDGMGMPKSLVAPIEEMMQGACMSFGLAPMLTAGACLAINAHASEELKQAYLPKMYSGEWSGAMDLTEPHCGTDLGLIRTKANPQDDGSYRVTGTKIFITWGEQDMSDNIVHLVLAKLPDAPKGSKGISLFLVPKFLPNSDGDLDDMGERNGVSCGSLEKKMGIKASATCVMNFDEAKGWLVGEPNQGLACMFTMMNYERLVVGIQGIGVAEASYQTAVDYARERTQGRSPTGAQAPEKEADSLLVHPDVRRMLLTMRSLNEASRAFYIYVSRFLDMAKFSQDETEKRYAQNMVALLTPITKGFITDMAFDTCVLGQQVLGGHGFIREWGQEQNVRDARITQIYEGTNGIQAMDLTARKIVGSEGKLLQPYLEEVKAFVGAQPTSNLITQLTEVTDVLQQVSTHIIEQSQSDPAYPGSVAVEYQNLFGYVLYAYMWSKMIASLDDTQPKNFTAAKKHSGDFYFAKILPRVYGLQASIMAASSVTMTMPEELF